MEGWGKGGGRVVEGWGKGGGRVREGWGKGGGQLNGLNHPLTLWLEPCISITMCTIQCIFLYTHTYIIMYVY